MTYVMEKPLTIEEPRPRSALSSRQIISLVPGDGQLDQMMRIIAVLGMPADSECRGLRGRFFRGLGIEMPEETGNDVAAMMTGGDPLLIDLALWMLRFNPMRRISAKEALHNSYFDDMRRQCVGTQQ
jgi:hypothetical protein